MVALALLVVTLGGCGSASDAGAPDRFDTARAWRLTELQVAAGQRPAGSPQLRRLAARLRPLLPRGRFEAIPGEPRLRNVVGLSLIHISEPTRRTPISYAVFCL